MSAAVDFYSGDFFGDGFEPGSPRRNRFERGNLAGSGAQDFFGGWADESVLVAPSTLDDRPLAPVVMLRPQLITATPLAQGGPSRVPVRLTRRGRAVLSAAAALTGLAVLAVAHLSVGGAHSVAPVSPAVVSVQSGDTLWSIAARVAPDRDPRLTVAQLSKANHLASSQLTPGQKLRIG